MKTLLITYGTVALILFSIGICGMLQSCIDSNYKEVEYKSTDDGRNVQVVDMTHNIRYVEFDGHEYVYFQNYNQGSMCHSPKCKCLKEDKK